MTSYKILFTRSAEKELRRISPPFLRKITEKIYHLRIDPRPSGIEMLKGEDRHFRFRQGDYRVIYEVDDAKNVVTVIKIGHRSEVYK